MKCKTKVICAYKMMVPLRKKKWHKNQEKHSSELYKYESSNKNKKEKNKRNTEPQSVKHVNRNSNCSRIKKKEELWQERECTWKMWSVCAFICNELFKKAAQICSQNIKM